MDTVLKALDINDVRIEESENPDFLLKCSGKNIGVEITHLYHNKHHSEVKSRAWEGECERVLNEAKIKWIERNQPKVNVSVTFNKDARFRRKEAKDWGKNLSYIISGIVPAPGKQSVVGKYAPISHALKGVSIPEEYDSIIIDRSPEGMETSWTQSTGGALPKLEASFVQETLDKKNLRVSSYREKAEEIWLVICIEDFKYSASFDVNENATDHRYKSLFDKLYLISRRNSTLYELEQAFNSETVT